MKNTMHSKKVVPTVLDCFTQLSGMHTKGKSKGVRNPNYGAPHARDVLHALAHYEFTYDGVAYSRLYRFGKLDPYFEKGDSVLAVFPQGKPHKSKLDSIFYHPAKEVKYLTNIESSDSSILIYSSLPDSLKPILSVTKTAAENEEKTQAYMYEKKKRARRRSEGSCGCEYYHLKRREN